MKNELKETEISLSSSGLLRKLSSKKRIILIIAAAAAVIAGVYAVVSGALTKKDDNNTGSITAIQAAEQPENAIVLSSTSDEIYLKNNTAQLQYNAYLKDAPDTPITWSSSDDAVATVDENGFVTAYIPGEIAITAAASYNGEEYSNSALLRIIQPAEGIYMPTTTIDLYKGGSGRMVPAAVSPANASNPKLTWASKNENIATVDENGYVRPVDTGMTEIYAVTEDGGFSGKCFVNVISYSVKVDSVSIENDQKADAYLKEGESIALPVSVMPANAKDKTLRWTSTNPAVASVSQAGFVRAIAEGETYINVASANGMNDIFRLTVLPGDRTDRLNLGGTPGYDAAAFTDGSVSYSYYNLTLDEIVDIQMSLDPPPKYNGGKNLASREKTRQMMDPSMYCEGAYKYQFLDLSRPNGVDAQTLNKYLEGKGVLEGHAQDFIDAANKYNVSELYLVAHSMLETGNGTSRLSRGIEVNGTTVYNMFGIGAYDSARETMGSRRAYEYGWTSVSKAIDGGAEWISEHYVNAPEGRQNTLYKMLFNPGTPGEHQYATDTEWAASQAVNLQKLFNMFPGSVKTYEVPVYEGMSPAMIN